MFLILTQIIFGGCSILTKYFAKKKPEPKPRKLHNAVNNENRVSQWLIPRRLDFSIAKPQPSVGGARR